MNEALEIDDLEKRTKKEGQLQQQMQNKIDLQRLEQQYREALDVLIVSESQVLNELRKEIGGLGKNAPVELEKRIEGLNEQLARGKEKAPEYVLFKNRKLS